MVVDFWRAQSGHSPLFIDGSSVEIVKSTKFLGVHLAENFTWSLNTSSITKKAQQRLYFLWRLRKDHLPPPILTMLYRGTIESILSSCITAWFGNYRSQDPAANQACEGARIGKSMLAGHLVAHPAKVEADAQRKKLGAKFTLDDTFMCSKNDAELAGKPKKEELITEKQQASTSLDDSSSWQGDDAELEAASQAVEDLLNTQELQIRDNPSSQSVRLPSQDSTDEPSQPDPTVRPEQSEPTVRSKKKSKSSVRPEQSESQSTTQERVTPKERLLPDSPVELEGWVRLWEKPNAIPPADVSWIKEDTERGLFTPVQTYKDITGLCKKRRVLKSDRMWFYPPEPPGYVRGALPTPDSFFWSRVFVWSPVGVWRCSLKYPRGYKCVGKGRNVHLYKSGYHHRVRHICDVSSWYTMLTEVLCCGPCTKAARSGEGSTVGRWLAWDPAILSQLSEAHRAMFPAVLTSRRGVDKSVVRLLRDRTEGNTMVKVWRQIQENHFEEYLHRKDLYTTLLMSLVEPGGIVSAMGHRFQAPPPPRELPSARLLRHAFLLAEANNVEDYRSQILSVFGTVLKMDSTKKVVKKLSGEGQGSAEWFTSIGNEHSQIVSFVLT
ncbi:hypothetical protein QTP86_007112 [Hemibagrus guttatus]|nr:hypothetical protein QTP86_007112 [Hemibagrus guttatus]